MCIILFYLTYSICGSILWWNNFYDPIFDVTVAKLKMASIFLNIKFKFLEHALKYIYNYCSSLFLFIVISLRLHIYASANYLVTSQLLISNVVYSLYLLFFLHNLCHRCMGQGISPFFFSCPFLFFVLILCITYINITRININNNKREKRSLFSSDVAVVIAKTPFSRNTTTELKNSTRLGYTRVARVNTGSNN